MASKERGLICTGESVRAFLDGRKTQTRRIAKLPEKWHSGRGAFKKNPHGDEEFVIHGDCGTKTMYCPHGRVGDKLWVRETVRHNIEHSNFYYTADNKGVGIECYQVLRNREKPYLKTISSRFMPKSLARIWLEITGVRVEKVQDITWQDCKAEGITLVGDELVFNNKKQKQSLMRTKFRRLWDSINAKRGYGWIKNPFVWCVEFRKVKS